MNKNEWLELVELAEELNNALLDGDIQTVVDSATNLINAVRMKAEDSAEMGGWYSELERYIDTMTFNNLNSIDDGRWTCFG